MKDFSFGVIPVFKGKSAYEFLLIQHQGRSGHWSFPKGHKESGESDVQTALREFSEETGIAQEYVALDESKIFNSEYPFFRSEGTVSIDKKVVYYIGYLDTKFEAEIQVEELVDYAWLPYDAAIKRISFSSDRSLLQEVGAYLDII